MRGWTDSPAFSPDGAKIAFISNEGGNNDIWIMDSDGKSRTQITSHQGSDDYVEWTAGGRSLLWSSDRGNGDADIWQVDIQTGEKRQLNDDACFDISPAASPNGRLIAFCSNRQATPTPDAPREDRDKDLWLMASDGSTPVRLTENQGTDFAPCWSPDGKNLIYTASDNEKACHLRVIDVAKVVAAYETQDVDLIKKESGALREQVVALDRTELHAEIDAKRRPTFLTSWLPDAWMTSCYPSGYFGLERNPHWIGVDGIVAKAEGSSASTTTAT